VAEVDPDDDSLRRFVVRIYRYDPDRHERRHVVVAAFDNETEFKARLDEVQADLLRRHTVDGPDADPREHVSGVVLEPGHRRMQQNARLLGRAMRHGVPPNDWEDLELPPNVAILAAGRPRPTCQMVASFLQKGPTTALNRAHLPLTARSRR